MVAKWIVAEVSQANRAAFSDAQCKWSEVGSSDGFIAQTGGWIESTSCSAGILSFWRDFTSYSQFMQSQHDELAASQRDIYEKIEVGIASVIMRIKETDPRVLAEKAEFVRVSDAILQPNSSPIFIARQMQIWNPTLESASGMMGALICRIDGNRDRFLAASFWQDRSALNAFRQELFPVVSKRASMETYMKSLVFHHFSPERQWLVVKRP